MYHHHHHHHHPTPPMQMARQRWATVAAHVRGGSFRPHGIARGGTRGGPVSRASTLLLTAVRRLLRGAQWLAAAAALARVVRSSEVGDDDDGRAAPEKVWTWQGMEWSV